MSTRIPADISIVAPETSSIVAAGKRESEEIHRNCEFLTENRPWKLVSKLPVPLLLPVSIVQVPAPSRKAEDPKVEVPSTTISAPESILSAPVMLASRLLVRRVVAPG